MSTTVQALAGWRSWRKFAEQEHQVNNYYHHRIDEAPLVAYVVFFCGVCALLIVLITIISGAA